MGEQPTRDDFERLEKRLDTIEGRIWQLVIAVFVLVVGYLFSQIQGNSRPTSPADTAALAFLGVAAWVAERILSAL